jgi:hypothetical protein
MAEYAETLYESKGLTEGTLILTDDYAPTTALLNPVTQAPYQGGEELLYYGSLNSFVIAGFWILVFLSLYILYTRMRGKVDNQLSLR